MTPELLRKLQGEKLRRDFTVTREAVNAEDRTIELSFSSELPYRRWFGDEILGHNEGEVDLGRLNNKASLLWNHNTDALIGVVEKAWIEGGKGRALVRFSKNKAADEVFTDVTDGIRSLVSVGYMVKSMTLTSKDGDVETHRVTEWEPYEISFVSVPADASVGVGRAATADSEPIEETPTKNTMTPEQLIAAEKTRSAEIVSIGNTHKVDSSLVEKAIADGTDANAFARSVLNAKAAAVPAVNSNAPAPVTEVKKIEQRNFSISKLLSAKIRNVEVTGVEKEVIERLEKEHGAAQGNFLIPNIRAQNTAVASEGGYLVGTEARPDLHVDALHPQSIARKLGVTVMSGLKSNITISTQTGSSNAQWLAEGEDTEESEVTFGQLTMSPKRLSVQVAISKKLILQSNPAADKLINDDINGAIDRAQDKAVFFGTGADGQPTGLFETEGTSEVTFSGAPTYSKMADFPAKIATENYNATNLKYAVTPSTFSKLKTIPKFAGGSDPIAADGKIDGFTAEQSNQLLGNKVAFGDWSQIILGEWGAYDLTVDTITRAGKGEVLLTLALETDVCVRQPKAFTVSTDAGNQ